MVKLLIYLHYYFKENNRTLLKSMFLLQGLDYWASVFCINVKSTYRWNNSGLDGMVCFRCEVIDLIDKVNLFILNNKAVCNLAATT